MKVIVVDHNSSLSRFKTFPEITIHGKRVRSVENAFWASFLYQHNFGREAAVLLNNPRYRDSPEKCAQFARQVVKDAGQRVNPQWVLQADHIYYAICASLINHGNNPFHDEMSAIRDEFGCNVKFLVPSAKDFVWSTGNRRPNSRSENPGFNLYGKLLGKLLKDWEGNEILPFIEPTEMFIPGSLADTPYRFTALIIGDSQLQQVKEVDGARVKSLGGGTFATIAKFIKDYTIDLGEHRFFLAFAGTNDCQYDKIADWERLFKPFNDVIKPFLNYDSLTIAIIGPIRNRDTLPYSAVYSRWLASKVRAYKDRKEGANNIFFFDWSGQYPENPFVDSHGGIEWRLMRDLLHYNHTGFKRQYKGVATFPGFTKMQLMAMTLVSDGQPSYPHGHRHQP